MSLEKEQIVSKTILLPIFKITKSSNDINSFIERTLQKQIENRCDKNGFVINNSIELINRSIGKIRSIDNISNIEYNVTIKMKSIIPSIDDIYDSKISSITKMGIISFLDYGEDCSLENSPILFITPNNYIDDTKNYKINDILKVKVLNIRIRFKGNQIQIISEPV
jgi:DNA-directed RNA polymerase subunit E'/Rpb7